MLYRNAPVAARRESEQGFTIIEVLVTTIIIAIVASSFAVIFKSTIFNFINMQTDASTSTALSSQTNRLGMVVRGTTDITAASANSLTIYSYFYPADAYVSTLQYYLRTSGGVTQLVADLTPMSANPPIGTPLTAQKRTFVIVDNYYQAPGVNLFTYLDASGNALALPIADLQSIKGIRVTLAAKASNGSNQVQTVQVSLRNRKTNL